MSSSNKYDEALLLYATTQLSIKEICGRLLVPFAAFSCYLCRNHRNLILKRQGLEGQKNVQLRDAPYATFISHQNTLIANQKTILKARKTNAEKKDAETGRA